MKHKIPCPHKDTCPNVFYTTVNSLNNHLYRTHNVAAPINCQQCHLGFTNASELKAHLKRVCTGNPSNPKRRQKLSLKQFYTEADGQFHCKICQKVIATKKYYQDHYQKLSSRQQNLHDLQSDFCELRQLSSSQKVGA